MSFSSENLNRVSSVDQALKLKEQKQNILKVAEFESSNISNVEYHLLRSSEGSKVFRYSIFEDSEGNRKVFIIPTIIQNISFYHGDIERFVSQQRGVSYIKNAEGYIQQDGDDNKFNIDTLSEIPEDEQEIILNGVVL